MLFRSVPSQATLSALFNGGLGVFEFELRRIFLLLKLHQRLQVAQLFSNGARGGGDRDRVQVGQRIWDLHRPGL